MTTFLIVITQHKCLICAPRLTNFDCHYHGLIWWCECSVSRSLQGWPAINVEWLRNIFPWHLVILSNKLYFSWFATWKCLFLANCYCNLCLLWQYPPTPPPGALWWWGFQWGSHGGGWNDPPQGATSSGWSNSWHSYELISDFDLLGPSVLLHV